MAANPQTNIVKYEQPVRICPDLYGEMSADVAREARAAARVIHALNGEISDRESRIGLELIRVKKLLPRGAWLPWLDAEFQWTQRQAQYLMRAARGFGRNTAQPPHDGKHYWVTPPDMMARLDAEFHFTDDVCPNPRPPDYDGLTAEWGLRNYCNSPFDNAYEWTKKAIAENAKGKLVVQILPSYHMKTVALLDEAGAEIRYAGIPDWRAIEDGSARPKSRVNGQICFLCILRPNWKRLPAEIGMWRSNRVSDAFGGSNRKNEAIDDEIDEILGGDVDYTEKAKAHCNWFTPPPVFNAMGVRFPLDPASPGRDVAPWIPADRHFTVADDGLAQDWFDLFCWLNPPFGRNRLKLWVHKFVQHGNGVILVPERSSAVWYQELEMAADLILHMNKKLTFITPDGVKQRQFPVGTHLAAIGPQGCQALINAYRAGLGLLSHRFDPPNN